MNINHCEELLKRYVLKMNKLSIWLNNISALQNRQGGKDEKENAISHLIGIVASLIYLIIIVVNKIAL